MALDPSILAALTAGAKTTATYNQDEIDAWKAQRSNQQKAGAWNLGQGIIDVLSTGAYATAGITNKLGQNVAAIQRGELGGAADFFNPISAIGSAAKGISDRRTYSDNLKEMGVDDKVAPWLGLALDIGLDPTTYITGGTLAAAKGAAQGAKLAAAASKTGTKLAKAGELSLAASKTDEAILGLGKTAEVGVAVGRPLTQSEKLGNLLTGIQRGAETGKLNYKVTLAGSKIQRMKTRDANKLAKVQGTDQTADLFIDAAKITEATEKATKLQAKKAKAEAKLAEKALPGVKAGTPKPAKAAKGTKGATAGDGVTSEAAVEATADAIAPGSTDPILQEAIRAEAIANAELKNVREQLAPLSKLVGQLDEFARTVPTPGAYKAGLKPKDNKNLAGLISQASARIQELAVTELGALGTSVEAIEKLTDTQLLNIMRKPASERSVKEQQIFEEIGKQEVAIPAEFNELAAEIAKVLDNEGVATLVKSDGSTSRIKTATKEQRGQWAADLNATKAFKDQIAANKKVLADAEKKLATAEKALDAEAAKYQKIVEDLAAAGKQTSAAATKQQAKVKKLADEVDAARVQIEGYKQGDIPAGEGPYSWWTSTKPIVGDDYYAFVNKTTPEDPELAIKATIKKKAGEKPGKSTAAPLSKEARNRLTEISRLLPTASKADKEALLAERATLTTKTELETVVPAELPPRQVMEKTDRISRTGLAESAPMLMIARMTKSKDPVVSAQAKKVFEDSRDGLASVKAEGPIELKPWVDGIVTANDAGKAARAFIRYAAPEMEQSKEAFKTAARLIENALEGKLIAAAGGKDVALSADEVAQVFEEFLSGRDFTKVIDDLGRVDINKLLEPGSYASIDDLAVDLQDGKLILSTPQLATLTKVLGVPVSNSDAAREIISKHADAISALLQKGDNLEVIRAQAREYLLLPTKGVLKLETAVEATGDVNGAAAAADLAPIVEPEQIVEAATKLVDELIAGLDPATDVANSTNAAQSAVAYREAAAARLQASIQSLGGRQAARDVQELFRDTVLTDLLRVVGAIAAKRGESIDTLLQKAIDEDWTVISEDPEALLMTGAFKVGELSSESRFSLYTRTTRSKATYKTGGTPEQILARENRIIGLVEELARTLGLPVTSTENYAFTLRRKGELRTGATLPEGTVSLRSNITYIDIANALSDAGRSDLLWELRKIRGEGGKGYGLGNFPPNAIEAAWLVVKNFKSSGKDVAKGSAEYDEVMFALSNVYKKPVDGGAGMLVDNLFTPSFQVRAANALGGAQATSIQKASDDLIEFLSENYDSLARLDKERKVVAGSKDAGRTYEQTSKLMLGILKYLAKYRAAKITAESANLFLKNEASDFFGGLMKDFDNLLDQLGTGAFHDPELAKFTSDLHASVLLNARLKRVAGSASASDGMPALKRELSQRLSTARAMDEAAATAAKAGKKTAPAAKNARNVQKKKNFEESASIAVKVAEDSPALVDHVSDNAPIIEDAIKAEVVNTELAASTSVIENLGRSMSGRWKMTQELKAVLQRAEQSSISNSHNFSRVLVEFGKRYKGQEDELRDAFSTLQSYYAEAKAARELADEVPSLAEFVVATGKAVNEEMLDLLDMAVKTLFGDDNLYGAAARTGVLADELNKHLAKVGLKAFGEVDGVKVADLDGFWTRVNIDDMPERSPLEFLNAVNIAVHRAAAQVSIGSSLYSNFGKSLPELKATGENIADWVKLDPEDELGKLIGVDAYFPKELVPKFRYFASQMTYDTNFDGNAINNLVQVSDRIVSVMKASNTVLRPGHWMTTVVGEAAMNTMAGVHYSAYGPATRILAQRNPADFKEGIEGALKRYAAQSAPKGMRVKETEFDNVWWIKGDKRSLIDDETAAQLADRRGVLLAGINPGIEDLLLGEQPLAKGLHAKFQNAIAKLSPAAAARDNLFRMSHFVHELRTVKGAKSLDEAADIAAARVLEWHPTVSNLSGFERKYLRRGVYFYVWQRVALTKIVATSMEIPGVATMPSKVQYAFAEYNGLNPESFGDPWDPNGVYASWHTGQLWGPQARSPFGGVFGDVIGIQPAVQPIDVVGQVVKPFTLQPGQSPLDSVIAGSQDLFGSNLNPVIKTLIESSAQSRLGPGGDLPGPAEYLLGQIGVINTLSKVSGFGQDPDPYQNPQEKAERDARLWANLLLGQRVTDYNTPSTQYKWKMDQNEIIKRLAGQ